MPPVRTKTACEIARIEPSRFNLAVHNQNYLCAPETDAGKARVFDRDEIVALRIFSAMTTLTLSERRAGHISCEALALIRDDNRIEAVECFQAHNGAWHTIAVYPGDKMVKRNVRVIFDIPALRESVEAAIKREINNQPIGED